MNGNKIMKFGKSCYQLYRWMFEVIKKFYELNDLDFYLEFKEFVLSDTEE